MDKTQNMKRGGAKKQRHTNKLFFGAFQFSKKPKKQEKVRSLSAVTSVTTPISEMGCHVSEKQQQEHCKRFKVHNNFLNGCYGASVPRKLRSAMKKRGRESILLDKEKVNHKINGIDSPEKDNLKKSKVIIKQEISQNCSKRKEVFGSITKDEEEVAETLHALAAMFPHNGYNHISKKHDGDSLTENANAALEASETGEGTSLCHESGLPGEASKITSLNETIIGQEQYDKAKLLVQSHSSTPTINLVTMHETVKREFRNKVALDDSELCLAMGLNMTGKSQISQCERKSDVELDTARDFESKQKEHMIKEQVKNESLALWPGLSSVSSAVSHKRSHKRCATHVYISHTIRSLELPKQGIIEESNLHECQETRASERSNHGAHLEVRNLNRMRNGVVTCDTVRNPNHSKNGILLQKCNYSETSQANPTPGIYGPQKQSLNFLSLSSGSYEVGDNNYNKVRSRLEPLSYLQVPNFQPLAQQQRVVPIPTQQSCYASTVYIDQLTVVEPQLRLQKLHYYGSKLCGTQYSSTVSNKQEHQNFWGMQQEAQVRSSVMGPCAQSIFPHTPTSQEIFSRRQQQLISTIQDQWERSSTQFYMRRN